jgi:hypothetical protein
LRGGGTDRQWLDEFRRRRPEANDERARAWRKNAWGAWLVIAALVVLLARVLVALS